MGLGVREWGSGRDGSRRGGRICGLSCGQPSLKWDPGLHGWLSYCPAVNPVNQGSGEPAVNQGSGEPWPSGSTFQASISSSVIKVPTSEDIGRIKGRIIVKGLRLCSTGSRHYINVCKIKINQLTHNEFNLKCIFFFFRALFF